MNNNHSLFIRLYQFFDNNLLEDFKYFLATKRYKSKMEETSFWRTEAQKKVKLGEVENEEQWTNVLLEKLNQSHYDSYLDFEEYEIQNEICYKTNADTLPELLSILVARNNFNFLTFLLEKNLINYESKQILFVESVMSSYHYHDDLLDEFYFFYDKLVTELLADKNDLDYIFVGNMNALMKACSQSNFPIIDKLLKYELNPAVMNEDGKKAIDYLEKNKKNNFNFPLNNHSNIELNNIKQKLNDLENVYYERKKLDSLLNKKLDDKEVPNNKKI